MEKRVFPFPQRYFADLEAQHRQIQINFFLMLLPGITLTNVVGIYRKQPPRCAWQVSCRLEQQIENGLADHIHHIVLRNKFINAECEPIHFLDSHNFSVTYNITCQCNVVDF